jgi:antitoxin HigA-1
MRWNYRSQITELVNISESFDLTPMFLGRTTMTTRKTKTMPPIHPGEVLAEDFMKPLGVSQYRIAKEMSVPARRINLIVKGRQAITADTALRLGRYFGMEAQFWMNLQARYDLEIAQLTLLKRLDREVTPRAKAA